MRNKNGILVIITLVVFFAGVMISCTHSTQNLPTPTVSFSKDIIPVFTAYCTLNGSCHLEANGTNLNVGLDSAEAYSCIISKGLISIANPSGSLLYVEINGNGIAEMPKPPTPALSASNQNLILNWIKQGAKNN